jgi:hypothetical protein
MPVISTETSRLSPPQINRDRTGHRSRYSREQTTCPRQPRALAPILTSEVQPSAVHLGRYRAQRPLRDKTRPTSELSLACIYFLNNTLLCKINGHFQMLFFRGGLLTPSLSQRLINFLFELNRQISINSSFFQILD